MIDDVFEHMLGDENPFGSPHGQSDRRDRIVLKVLAKAIPALEFCNTTRPVRKISGRQSGRICLCAAQRVASAHVTHLARPPARPCARAPPRPPARSSGRPTCDPTELRRNYAWHLTDDSKFLNVRPELLPRYCDVFGLSPSFDGKIDLPWDSRAHDEQGPFGTFHPSRSNSIDFWIEQSSDTADVLRLCISPFGSDWQVSAVGLQPPPLSLRRFRPLRPACLYSRARTPQACLHIMNYGSAVEVEVQRKLPEPLRPATDGPDPLFMTGPRAVCHMSGETQFESSGAIALPRPLARDGDHTYLNGPQLMQELDLDELQTRGDVDDAFVASHSVLILHLHLQPPAAAAPKRRRTFAPSPRGTAQQQRTGQPAAAM